MSVKSRLLALRAAGTRWLPELGADHLRSIREYELGLALPHLPRGARVLEVGAGAGWQSARLRALGYDVEAVDVEDSNYRDQRVFPVRIFDGYRFPYADSTFDCVFSSNVLEHVSDESRFHRDLHRVLRPDGVAVHVVPTGSWALWTTLLYPVRYWTLAGPHGEHASFALQEVSVFSRKHWRAKFESYGWDVADARECGLFYTGINVLGSHLSMAARQGLAPVLGSSTHLFVMRHPGRPPVVRSP